MTEQEMEKILEIGLRLSSEKNHSRLLEGILADAMELTSCDAGTLYLKEGEYLRFRIMQNHTLHTYQGGDGREPDLPPVPINRESVCSLAVLEDKTICVEDVRSSREYDFSGPIRYDAMTGYLTKSMLVVPMKSHRGEVSGVLQLINAMDQEGRIVAFPSDKVKMIESVASQAAICIQNMNYVEEIRRLFHSLVKLLSQAIDERTPYNAAHTRNMAAYGERFLDFLNEKREREGKEALFSPDHREEFLMSVWLHDIGKLVTPLEVMNKAARLTPEEEKEIFHRFEVMRLLIRIRRLEGEYDSAREAELLSELARAGELIRKADTCGYLTEELLEEIHEIAERTYETAEGDVRRWLTGEEERKLSIRKGTLTMQEREIMENHVKITARLLSEIKFTGEYRRVPYWAASHHELLDGSGYPGHLSGDAIPLESRILTILDIFDALTADDRPYKPGMPVEKALGILQSMAKKEGKLDENLTELFVESRCWEKVQRNRQAF